MINTKRNYPGAVPCPFCGNELTFYVHGLRSKFMACGMCGASGPDKNENAEQALLAWNRSTKVQPEPAKGTHR